MQTKGSGDDGGGGMDRRGEENDKGLTGRERQMTEFFSKSEGME